MAIMPRHHEFVKTVVPALRRRCGIGRGDRVVVAVSGGGDSVALLRALAAIAPRRRWHLKLIVAHVQHHLRQQAEEDASFTRSLATELKLPFVRADLDGRALQAGGNLEAAARIGRYRALAELAEAAKAGFIATGHHGDDQLETMLMRILRGSSVRGLLAMPWRRPLEGFEQVGGLELIRPMLGLDRAAVGRFLEDIGQPWREDHTNADPAHLRARLRRQVLPVLHEISPDAAAKAVSLGDHLRELTQLLDATVARVMIDLVSMETDTIVIERKGAAALVDAVLIELLRRILISEGAPADRIGRKVLDPVCRALRDPWGGRRVFRLAGGLELAVSIDALRIRKRAS